MIGWASYYKIKDEISNRTVCVGRTHAVKKIGISIAKLLHDTFIMNLFNFFHILYKITISIDSNAPCGCNQSEHFTQNGLSLPLDTKSKATVVVLAIPASAYINAMMQLTAKIVNTF